MRGEEHAHLPQMEQGTVLTPEGCAHDLEGAETK